MYADDPVNHVGNHYYRIKSCIQVYNNGQLYTCANCCSDSAPFEITIYDPCTEAVIESQAIVGTLAAQQLGSDSLDLSNGSGWPWDAAIYVEDQVLYNMCGAIEVNFYVSGTTESPGYIQFVPETGLLTLRPLIGDPVGDLSIDMVVLLSDYAVTSTQTFTVTISSTDDCAFDVISFGNNFDEETYTFTVPVNTLTFDPLVSQTVSNCPRQCSFYENTQPLSLPSLFVSDVDTQTGAVSFASGTTYLDDSVFCMLIVCESLESQMPDDQRITFDRFTVRFEIDCSQDQIEFVSDFNTIDYYPAIG